MPLRASKLLPSIGHAASGAGGTVVSTLATYPLDLVNTRLKVQRQLRADGTIRDEDAYRGMADAFATIYGREGGLAAFFAGLGSDLAKSAADSFLFFLFYTWFRARRLRARNDARYLSALEELAVGAVAGMCAKAFTTPVSNVVTRKQTASLLKNSSSNKNNNSPDDNNSPPSPPESPSSASSPSPDLTFSEIVADIRREKGLAGLWAGYSASLVLTLNPSLTFFLQQLLKRMLVPRRDWDEPGARATFFLAALSKSAATTVTYPFQIAKARVQVSSAPSEDKKKKENQQGRTSRGDNSPAEKESGKSRNNNGILALLLGDTIFATVFRIGKAEGIKALYDGIGGELIKAFFNHGTTMTFKDIIHRLLVRAYLAVLIAIKGWPLIRAQLRARLRKAYEERASLGSQVREAGQKGVEYVKGVVGSSRHSVVGVVSGGGGGKGDL